MKILYKDKKDITNLFINVLPKGYYLGAMERPTKEMLKVEILSVKFSKVGKTTLERMPNLKYIINRAHGTDNINLKLCKAKNVKVIAACPTAREVAGRILFEISRIPCIPPYTLFGYGSIGKLISKEIPTRVVRSTTSVEEITRLLKTTRTLIVTVPLNETTDNYFHKHIFNHLKKARLIHISRAETLNNPDLLEAIKNKSIIYAIIDTLGPRLREKLIATGKVEYTEHTFWKFRFDEDRYLKSILRAIKSIKCDY